MLSLALDIALTLIGTALLLNGWRLLRGPDALDRIIALDTLYLNVCSLLILYGIRLGTKVYFEATLMIAMLGFLSTVVLAKFLLRGDIIE